MDALEAYAESVQDVGDQQNILVHAFIKTYNDMQEDATAQEDVQSLLSACNMSELLNIKINRDIGRHNNLEVWV